MNRREALQSLTTLAATTGLTVTPMTTKEAEAVSLVILKVPGMINEETADRLRMAWKQACEGTDLAGVKALVLCNGVEVELVREGRRP